MGRNSVPRYTFLAITLLVCVAFVSVCPGQVAIPTGRADSQRSAANINETLLTPANVNSNQFGALFNYPIDYQALAQPLYVPGVNINGLGTLHNVVYVATMADSVYAFDADSNAGSNATPLWSVNFTNPANGITLASIWINPADLPCAGNGSGTVGFGEEGIAGTPVIDTVGGTLYVVAKTVENGTVRHRLHALDITSGAEKFGGPIIIGSPIPITTTYVSPITNKTYTTTFNSLHQLNRPGLLLQNGVVYIAFGSNSCNDLATGWVLSYDATSLGLKAVFNSSPQHGLASIWQTGNGIAADEFGNLFVETAETCGSCFDVNQGGATYANSVVELDPNTLTVTGYFTPYDVQFLNQNDLDMSSTGVLVLPDQGGPTPHELIAGGKEGIAYVLDRDNMGSFNGPTCSNPPTCDNALQEVQLLGQSLTPPPRPSVLFSSPAYWNNTVYFTPDGAPIAAYPLSGESVPLGTPIKTAKNYPGEHSPSISANGTDITTGILWAISGAFYAFNATTMQQLYSSNTVKARDTLPAVGHFATQTVANGKAYIATAAQFPSTCSIQPCPGQLSVYGLLPSLRLVSGSNQSGPVGLVLPAPIQLQIVSPYGGAGVPGVTVTFSDGGKKGTFSPASVVSDSNGNVSTAYTFSKTAGVDTITASATGYGTVSFTETALPGPATRVIVFSGNKQTGPAGSILPIQLKAEVQDANGNGVGGVTVTFAGSGNLNPSSGASNASGFVFTTYQLPNTPGTYKISATGSGLKTAAQFVEYATLGAPATVTISGGNNQFGPAGTTLPQALSVVVADQYGNLVSGVAVTFSDGGGGGSFSNANPVTTDNTGTASQVYTLPPSPGPVSVSATATGVATPAVFTETGQ
jgi:hypothetical protein